MSPAAPSSRPLLARWGGTVAVLVALGVPAGVLVACGPAGDDDAPGSAGSANGVVTCRYVADGDPARPVDPPDSAGVPARGTVDLDLATNRGDVTLALARGDAPCAVNSLTALAQQKFFDDTPCHRLTTAPSGIYVLQCGDPTGTGQGGPGYRFDDEIRHGQTYPAGTVAMANVGPNTNGSQFFLVYEDSPLPASYTAVGMLTDDGLQAVRRIAAAGTDSSLGNGDGSPKEPVTIRTATVREG